MAQLKHFVGFFRRSPRVLGTCALAVAAGLTATHAIVTAVGDGDPAMKAPLASQSLLLDVARRDDLVVTVGERGHILVSRDGGGSWTQADVPSRALLTGVFMFDQQLGWAVGHDEIVLRTRDGGLNWERVHYAPDNERPLLDVWFADDRRGLAISAYGGLLATSDGGDTWESRLVSADDDFHLNHIVMAADGALYLAAEAGHLYRSDDGGETWQSLPSPYAGSFFGLLPLSDGSLLAFGLRGHLFRSQDRGGTWEQIATETEATLTSGLEIAPGRFVIAGLAGTVLWGDAEGRVRKQELDDRKGIVAVARADDRTLLLFGEGGVQHLEIAN